MRKISSIILAFVISLASIIAFSSCSNENTCEHKGGTATCTAKAICSECSESYGDFNANNHSSAEFTYAQNASDATKHDKKHACCGALVESASHSGGTATATEKAKCEFCGIEYGELASHSHTGGVASCTSKAVCSTCNESYGELNASNHSSAEFTYAANANDATKHDKKRACCGALVESASHSGGVATATEKAKCEFCNAEYGNVLVQEPHVHTGGVASCTSKAICESCLNPYGELNASNHSSAEFTYTVNANDATKHDKKYACCGALVESVSHSGGVASCTSKAVCESCLNSYGELNTSNHSSAEFTYTVNANDTTKHDKKRACCVTVVETVAHTGGEATCKNGKACEFCSAVYTNPGNHVVESVSSVPQSCTLDAKASYKCKYCDYSYETVTASKTGHSVSVWNVVSTTAIAGADCKYTVVYSGYCNVCQDVNATKTEEQIIHSYSAVVVAEASCVNDGTKKYTCSQCSASYTSGYSNSEAHNWTNSGEAVNGIQAQECTACEATKNVIAINGNSHTIDKSVLGNNELKLDNIAITLDNQTLEAIGEGNVTISAAEISSDKKSEVLASLDEEQKAILLNSAIYDFTLENSNGIVSEFDGGYVTVTVPYTISPTDDPDLIVVWFIADDGKISSIAATYANGFVTFKTNHFSNYAPVFVEAYDACIANGHNEIKGETVAPTCTENGYTVYTCSRCGNIRFGDLVYTAGHEYSDSVYTAPGCTTAGSNVFTCTVEGCGYVNTLVIPAEHAWEMDYEESIASSCQKTGVDVYKCSDCGVVKKEIVPASEYNHNYGEFDSEAIIPGNKYEFANEDLGCAGGVRIYSECSDCGYVEDYGISYDCINEQIYSEEIINISDYISINGTAKFVLKKCECPLCGKVKYESINLVDENYNFTDSNCNMYFYDIQEQEYIIETQPMMWSDPVYKIKIVTYIESDAENICKKAYKLDIFFDYDEDSNTAAEKLSFTVSEFLRHNPVQNPVLDVENGRCDMGVTVNFECSDCGTVTDTMHQSIKRGEHYFFDPGLLVWADLSEYSTKGHKSYVKEYRCPCGSSKYVLVREPISFGERCEFSKTETTEGEWNVTTYTCNCGISYQELVKTVAVNNCITNTYYKMRWNYDSEAGEYTQETALTCYSQRVYHWDTSKTEYIPTEYPCFYEYTTVWTCRDCGADCSEYWTSYSGMTYKHNLTTTTTVDAMGNVTVISTCSDCDYETKSIVSNGHEIYNYAYSMDYRIGLITKTETSYKVISTVSMEREYETYSLVSYIDPVSGEVVSWKQSIKIYNIGGEDCCSEIVYTVFSDGRVDYQENNLCERHQSDYVYQDTTCTQSGYSGYVCALCGKTRITYNEFAYAHDYEPFYGEWNEETMTYEILYFYCTRCGAEHVCSFTDFHQSAQCESFTVENLSIYSDESFVINYTTTLSDKSGVNMKLVAVSFDGENNRTETEIEVSILDDGVSKLTINKAAVNEALNGIPCEFLEFIVEFGEGSGYIRNVVTLY